MEEEPVVPSAVILSDHVIREAGSNKLTLIGTFSVWNAQAFPFVCPQFFITTFITNLRADQGQIVVTIRIETPEKHVVWSSQAKVEFNVQGSPSEAVIELPIPVKSVSFPFAGKYMVKVLANGDEVGTRDLFVRPITSGSAP
jgi:hypothetical protein